MGDGESRVSLHKFLSWSGLEQVQGVTLSRHFPQVTRGTLKTGVSLTSQAYGWNMEPCGSLEAKRRRAIVYLVEVTSLYLQSLD